MKKYFTPTWKVESIFSVTPEQLIQKNIKAVIVDLDNTLLPWNEVDHSEDMEQWITSMRAHGLGIYLLSNNNYNRVAKVAEPLELKFSASALKPRGKYFRYAISDLKVSEENVVVIGDQLITDVLGANRRGLQSILVKPMVPNDNIFTWANRTIERGLLRIVGIDRNENWGNELD
ncbi:YqeG family HAD IIIA-type phosphatase [Aerococcaceae bacterium DSM 111022]|nr:YqeG family HAD IIIA-type phosphatase [Aerococcaceae bacterium DSM 111022]